MIRRFGSLDKEKSNNDPVYMESKIGCINVIGNNIMKIAFVAGTRPEFIKLSPLINLCNKIILHSGY